jgi:hypothetical protein
MKFLLSRSLGFTFEIIVSKTIFSIKDIFLNWDFVSLLDTESIQIVEDF